ncbi:cyclopropane-fatty-acyl-phospholipid synthase family protein [Phenylobacterium sp.]|uniref:SAM-dependent methyltransferase n=1 Tax=Phenylobacterium sp. TaxID=1871053 RepID=UPI002730EFB5|nr:class I SAM-dependent methyltransferase [Phenylobacterium sp.]MDP1619103.1 class I SAM-dependent methyltransferase [Phenylobacterium sp.]MDP1988656.1 class I SAM-dependent methyltransferase [Phenylobacterium sp.]
MSFWDERYQGEAYLFGEAPNAFLSAQAHRLKPGMSALAVADGEGRNGVWLAEQGLDVLSVDSSPVAQAKAARLAAARGVTLRLEEVDLASWTWPEAQFDVVAAIFIQFAGPDLRDEIFAGMKRALKPGGLLLLEGYRPEQIAYGTGGPRAPENLYTEALLRAAFSNFEILELSAYDAVIEEGAGHSGQSALIDLVARRSV